MKKIVRLTENDLARIVKRVINEGEEELANQIDTELDSIDVNNPDPKPFEKIVDMIQSAGHSVEKMVRRLKRNAKKFQTLLDRNFDFDQAKKKFTKKLSKVTRNVTRNIFR
jgi:DNA repair ATPase RecN